MILLPLLQLHLQQSVCRLSSAVMPPFAIGMMWSISNSRCGSCSKDTPHFLQAKLSRSLIRCRSLLVIRAHCPAALLLNLTVSERKRTNRFRLSISITTSYFVPVFPPGLTYLKTYFGKLERAEINWFKAEFRFELFGAQF